MKMEKELKAFSWIDAQNLRVGEVVTIEGMTERGDGKMYVGRVTWNAAPCGDRIGVRVYGRDREIWMNDKTFRTVGGKRLMIFVRVRDAESGARIHLRAGGG